MNRQELKIKLSEILNKHIKKPGNGIMIGVIMPELPHLEGNGGWIPENAINAAREINEITGLATNVRLASNSGIIYAKFTKKESI